MSSWSLVLTLGGRDQTHLHRTPTWYKYKMLPATPQARLPAVAALTHRGATAALDQYPRAPPTQLLPQLNSSSTYACTLLTVHPEVMLACPGFSDAACLCSGQDFWVHRGAQKTTLPLLPSLLKSFRVLHTMAYVTPPADMGTSCVITLQRMGKARVNALDAKLGLAPVVPLHFLGVMRRTR